MKKVNAKIEANRAATTEAYNKAYDVDTATKEEKIIAKFECWKINAEEDLQKFKDNFIKNPHYAFDWSLAAFEASSTLYLVNQWLPALKDGKTNVEYLLKYVENEVINKGRWPLRSTSTTSNLVHQCDLQIIAKILNTLKNNE